jgi:hypothetical protein
MKRTKSGTIAFYCIVVVMIGLLCDSCNLGKKSCGCGMDLNGTMRQRHGLFRR